MAFKRIGEKVVSFLKQGISPQKLALTLSIGFCLGTIPLLGSTFLLCTAVAFIFRLNLAAIQAVNYAVYPLQLIFYVPFLKAGASLFSEQKFNYSLVQIVNMLSEDLLGTIYRFFWINMSAILLWLIISAVISFPIYLIANKAFTGIALKMQKSEQIQG